LVCGRSCTLTQRATEMCTGVRAQRGVLIKDVDIQDVRILIRKAIKLLEDVYFIQRRAATKLLTIRLNDSSMVG